MSLADDDIYIVLRITQTVKEILKIYIEKTKESSSSRKTTTINGNNRYPNGWNDMLKGISNSFTN